MKPSASKRLAELRDEARKEYKRGVKRARQRPVRTHWKAMAVELAIGAAKIGAIIALPFLLYVRASVFFYYQLGGRPWVAVAGGITLTLIVVAAYATWLMHGVFGKKEFASIARWVAAPLAGGFLIYSLLVLAKVNAKGDDVRAWYSSLHPVLRVAVSTAIIVDRGMVVTDMQRVAADYGKMGLAVNNQTRHYVQKDGWVHAVDLRTNGRNEVRNLALQACFWSMGFSTLRHVGTSDHLHVQLR